jgi:acetoin utilization protein AcuB
MIIERWMSRSPKTIRPNSLVVEAEKIMQEEGIRGLPVVDKDGTLVGIVTLNTLRKVMPSPATTLSKHEVNYLLAKMMVEEVMTKKVITCTAGMPVEEAALIMNRHKIAHLPVVEKGDRLVGIITETDLLRLFVQIMGVEEGTCRLVVKDLPVTGGEVERITRVLQKYGPIICSMVSLIKDDKRTLLFRIKTDKGEVCANLRCDLTNEGYNLEEA